MNAPNDVAISLVASGVRLSEAWYAGGVAQAPHVISTVQGIPTLYTTEIELLGNVVGPPATLIQDWALVTMMAAVGAPGTNELVTIHDQFECEITVRDNTDVEIEDFLSAWALVYQSGRISQGYQLSHFTRAAYAPGPAGSAEIGDSGTRRRLRLNWPAGFLRLNWKSDRLFLQNVLGVGSVLTSAIDLTLRATRGIAMTYATAQMNNLIGTAESCAPSVEALAKAAGAHRAVRAVQEPRDNG